MDDGIQLPGGYEMTERTRFKVRVHIDEGKDYVPVDVIGVKNLGPFQTLTECQVAYVKLRDELDLGASQFSSGTVFDEMKQEVASISYNGRLWSAGPWTADKKPLAEAPIIEPDDSSFKF